MGSADTEVSIWLRPPRPSRAIAGQSVSRDEVAAAAMELADDGGLAAVTMRSVAAHLGMTAMSLYWYVDSKNQLIELLVDAAFREQPGPVGDTWRELLRDLAAGDRARFTAHPWLVSTVDRPVRVPSPAQLDHYERVMAALLVLRPGLDAAAISTTVSLVDHFVAGHTRLSWPASLARHADEPGVREYLDAVATDGRHPAMASFFGQYEAFAQDRFADEIERVLDGLAPFYEDMPAG